MKKMYRCVIRYLDPKHLREVSNIFMRAHSHEQANAYARSVVEHILSVNGFGGMEFSVKTHLSSDEEADLFKKNGASNDRSVN